MTSNLIHWEFAVIGAGGYGLSIARELAANGANTALIEQDEKLVNQIKDSQLIRDFNNLKVIFGHGFFDETGQVIVLDPETGDEQHTVAAEVSIIACGEETSFLGLTKLGINLDENQRILVNASFQTAARQVYAAGDCSSVGGTQNPESIARQIASGAGQTKQTRTDHA